MGSKGNLTFRAVERQSGPWGYVIISDLLEVLVEELREFQFQSRSPHSPGPGPLTLLDPFLTILITMLFYRRKRSITGCLLAPQMFVSEKVDEN